MITLASANVEDVKPDTTMVAGGTLGFVGFIFAVVGRAMMAAK